MVLLAIGFDGTEEGPLLDQLGIARSPQGTVDCGRDWQSGPEGVFVAGDMHWERLVDRGGDRGGPGGRGQHPRLPGRRGYGALAGDAAGVAAGRTVTGTIVNLFVDGSPRRDYVDRMAFDTVALDAVFDALANQPRREIVTRLSRGPMTTPDVGHHFGFTKQALSRHVGVLENAGLITRTLRGRVHELVLVPVPLGEISRWVAEIRRGWESSLDRLDDVLRRNDG